MGVEPGHARQGTEIIAATVSRLAGLASKKQRKLHLICAGMAFGALTACDRRLACTMLKTWDVFEGVTMSC